MLQAKLITAGPRGNKCRDCENKIKAPNVILRVQGEYNRFTGHARTDNYCANCAKKHLIKAETKLKEIMKALEEGPSQEQLGSRKIRTI